jgi:gluconokinase
MGVSGCGKSSVGKRLSQILGWPFFDGDDFHPPENVAKMRRGIPLDDSDRAPWLAGLHDLLARHIHEHTPVILACSALKSSYRQVLRGSLPSVHFIFLKGSFELIYGRMQARQNHYMAPEMLQSQFDIFEEPQNALVVSIEGSPGEVSDGIYHSLVSARIIPPVQGPAPG